MRDVVVVGGGPAGSLSAGLLARNRDVVVLEEHASSGKPLECTGLVSPEVLSLLDVKPAVFNSFSKADIVFPGGSVFHAECRDVAAVLIDRTELDVLLAHSAEDAGAEFRYSERCESYSVEGGIAKVSTGKGVYESRIAIGADGHSSMLRRAVCDRGPDMTVRGIQVDLAHEDSEQDRIKIIMGGDIAPGFFAWSIPCGDSTRVGLCSEWSHGPPADRLKALLKKLGLSDCRVLDRHAGKIPMGGCGDTFGDGTLLIGDAACQVKPVSGGGLYPILKSAPCLARAVEEAFESGDFSSGFLSRYQRYWRSAVGGELSRGYRLRRMYCNLSDDDLDSIFRIVDRPFVHDIVSGASIDRPSDIIVKMLRHPVSAMRMAPYLLKGMRR